MITSSISAESQFPSETAIEPANTVTSSEREQFLRNIINSASQDFPELGGLMDWLIIIQF